MNDVVRRLLEAKRWSEVTPCMMSDEEERGDTYVRHPPLYRLNILSRFIDKLDSRCEKPNSTTNHPHKVRILGSSLNVPIPPDAKKWMLKPEMRDTGKTCLYCGTRFNGKR